MGLAGVGVGSTQEEPAKGQQRSWCQIVAVVGHESGQVVDVFKGSLKSGGFPSGNQNPEIIYYHAEL